MTDKELDDLFKNAFANHKMPIPGDMWQRVQPQSRKRRGAVVWWSASGIAMAVIVTSIIWMYQYHPSEKKNTASSLSQKRKEIKTRNRIPAGKPVSSVQKKSAGSYTAVDSLLNNKQVVLKNKNNRHNHQVSSELKKNKSEVIISAPNTTTDKKESDTNKINAQINEMADGKRNRFTDATKQAGISETTTDTPFSIMPDSAATQAKKETAVINKQADKEAAAPVAINKKDTKEKTEIEFVIAGYLSDRQVYDVGKSTSMPAFVLGTVNPEIKASVGGFSANLRLSEPIAKNLIVKTGLQFLQNRQSIVYTQQSVTPYAFVSTLTSSITDTMRYLQVSQQRPLAKSVYNSINIPLLIGYQTTGSKINVGVTAGALINFISWYHGDVPDGDYSKLVKASNTFKWNNGVSLYAGLHIGRTFGNWQLFAEPHLQYALSSITKNSALFKQKINSYGVGIGIKKKIGR